jgi:hypothetical protein
MDTRELMEEEGVCTYFKKVHFKVNIETEESEKGMCN